MMSQITFIVNNYPPCLQQQIDSFQQVICQLLQREFAFCIFACVINIINETWNFQYNYKLDRNSQHFL